MRDPRAGRVPLSFWRVHPAPDVAAGCGGDCGFTFDTLTGEDREAGAFAVSAELTRLWLDTRSREAEGGAETELSVAGAPLLEG